MAEEEDGEPGEAGGGIAAGPRHRAHPDAGDADRPAPAAGGPGDLPVACAGGGGATVGLAWTDVAAGEFRVGEFDLEAAAAELERLAPAEVLVPRDRPAPPALLAGAR